jgi:glycosyltransferase involved in cell wall biosynthesis
LYNKHILIALHRFQVGGAERQASYLGVYLAGKGYRVTVGAFGSEKGDGFDRFDSVGVQRIHWGFQEKILLDPEKSVEGYLLKIKYLIKLIFKVRNLKVDYIIPFTYPANIIFCSWYTYMGAQKCFWNQRDLGIGFNGLNFEKKAIDNSTIIISNSEGGKRFLRQITNKSIRVIVNGVKISEEILNQSKIKEGFRVVMVANITENKDHLTLLKAWRLVINYFGDYDTRLILAGQKGNAYPEVLRILKNENIEKSVEIIGNLNDVRSFLFTCQIGILSSFEEGMSNAVLEYMASGLPVIVSDIPANREILGEDYPFFFKPGSEESLSGKLIEMINSKELRKKYGGENLKKVSSDFTIEVMGNQYVQLL